MPRKRFLKKRRMAASTITLVRYSSGVLANQRDFQSRMMPRRCAYGCTVCVIVFYFAFLARTFLAGALVPSSKVTMDMVLRIVPERPRAKGRERRMTAPLLTAIVFT